MLYSATRLDDVKRLIKKSSRVVLCFIGLWCPQCVYMEKAIEELSRRHKEITFVNIYVGRDEELIRRFQVYEIPKVMLLDKERIVDCIIGGIKAEDLEKWLLSRLS